MLSIKKAQPVEEPGDNYIYRFSWLHLCRPLTLTGTISPVLVGTALASKRGQVQMATFIAICLAALLVQAAINMFNDYFDFRNGQDHEKWVWHREVSSFRAPVHHTIPIVASGMLIVAAVLGLWLAYHSSFWIIPVGLLSIVCGYAYSGGKRPLASIALGELVAAVFLGPVVTVLAYVVQGYALDARILAVSFTFSLLISTMILSNNIRDIKKDEAFRMTLAMMLGRRKVVYLLAGLLTCAYLWVIYLILFQSISLLSGIVLLALPCAVRLCWSFRPEAERVDETAGMKWAAVHHWTFGLLFAGGIWFPF